MTTQASRSPLVAWTLLGSVFLAALVWACGTTSDGDPNQSTNPTDTTSGGTTSGGTTSGGTTSGGTTSGGTTSGGVADAAADTSLPDGTISTDPNLKVAFIGDTGTGNDFKSVLELIKREGANLVMVQGDLAYIFQSASGWFSAIDGVINKAQPGSAATVTIPYFAAKGNHDSDWGTYGPGLKSRMTTWGITSENGDPTTKNYSVVHKGLKMVMVDESETSPTRADYVTARLQNDPHLWKICSWHKDQRATNVGPKSDEMGWAIYENCRKEGAIVVQGHSHTYSRSKTLTNDTAQTVDATCSDPFALCLGAGKHFFLDSSLGGYDMRPLESNTGAYWGATYSGSFGALFITFNVGGDPRKAQGYFKTVGDVVVDPPASSGKSVFTITRLP